MLYSAALVLSTLALSQAAAVHNGARHAGFHARRNAAPQYGNVDWNDKNLYKDVKWDDINWKSVFDLSNKPTAAPTVAKVDAPEVPAAVPTKSAEEPKPVVAEKKPEKPKVDDLVDDTEDFLEDLLDGVQDFCKKKGIFFPPENSKTPNNRIWLGKSKYQAIFKNEGHEDVFVACWNRDGPKGKHTGMTINVTPPVVFVKIPVGKSQPISFEPGQGAACSHMFSDTELQYGIIYNPWFEATFGEHGTFDVSRNTRMDAGDLEIQGSKCTSNMEKCVFVCTNGQNSCTMGSDYTLKNCLASDNGGAGYDTIEQGAAGGCTMNWSQETLRVSIRG